MNKNEISGEDSVIIKTMDKPGPRRGASLIGVADGVGGWRRYGVDPSYISSGVLHEMGLLFQKKEEDGDPSYTPQRLLTESFKKLLQRRDRFSGGTTVCFGEFDPETDGIKVLNIGDSGALLVRDGKIVERTEFEVNGMTPRQLTILPSWMLKFKGTFNEDPIVQTKSAIKTWQLQKNDILLMASDGYYDNVSLDDTRQLIVDAVELNGFDAPEFTQKLAETLLMKAYYNSLNPDFVSPFALKCYEYYQECDYSGGKPDDISLVVSEVR